MLTIPPQQWRAPTFQVSWMVAMDVVRQPVQVAG